jgi:hypothetical protein
MKCNKYYNVQVKISGDGISFNVGNYLRHVKTHNPDRKLKSKAVLKDVKNLMTSSDLLFQQQHLSNEETEEIDSQHMSNSSNIVIGDSDSSKKRHLENLGHNKSAFYALDKNNRRILITPLSSQVNT